MRAIDTNVLVRAIVRDDPRQAQQADRFIADGAWVSILTIAETCWVLTAVYDRSADDIATAIETLLGHQHLVLQDSDAVENALESFRTRPALGFTDCLLVAIARKAGHLPLGTFDRGLARLDGVERI